jgi:hypothetical protein
MLNKSTVTIIDKGGIRGILAPSSAISKKSLQDMIDFLELSSPELQNATRELEFEADNAKSWVSLEEMRKLSETSM